MTLSVRVAVPVMEIWVVGMLVPQWRVLVRMSVWLTRRVSERVLVLMVFVVDVAVLVIECLVPVLMDVCLREMEVEP